MEELTDFHVQLTSLYTQHYPEATRERARSLRELLKLVQERGGELAQLNEKQKKMIEVQVENCKDRYGENRRIRALLSKILQLLNPPAKAAANQDKKPEQ